MLSKRCLNIAQARRCQLYVKRLTAPSWWMLRSPAYCWSCKQRRTIFTVLSLLMFEALCQVGNANSISKTISSKIGRMDSTCLRPWSIAPFACCTEEEGLLVASATMEANVRFQDWFRNKGMVAANVQMLIRVFTLPTIPVLTTIKESAPFRCTTPQCRYIHSKCAEAFCGCGHTC